MPLQSSGSISLAQIQTELGGANPIGVNEYTGTTQVKSRYRYSYLIGGTLSIDTGGAAAYPPSGFTGLNNGSLDDSPQFNISFNFNFKFLGVTYASLFVSPNTYITFGAGSGQYGGLSASNPALPKIFLGATDNSLQRLSYKHGPENSYLHIRYEGTAGTSGSLGSPNIVYEIIFYDPRSTNNVSKFDVYFGQHSRADQIFRICSASADVLVPGNYGSGPGQNTSLAANTAYSFSGDSDGNSWTVQRSPYDLLLSINNPQGNMVEFSNFYGVSGGGGGGVINLVSTLQALRNTMSQYMSSYKNPSFFDYILDGNDTFINDGGADMYDIGNFTTPWMINNVQYTSNQGSVDGFPARISYANTTVTTFNTSLDGSSSVPFVYASVSGYVQNGTTRPLMVIGTRSGIGYPIGWQKGGNSGADGGGTLNQLILRDGSLYNAFTVHAFTRQTYNAGDPSHCDLYMLLGHPNWNSTFGVINSFADPIGNGGNGGYFYTSGAGVKNILAITLLLSKAGGSPVMDAECQTIVNSIVDIIKAHYVL